MNNSNIYLGRYAIWQYGISTQPVTYRQSRQNKSIFPSRFIRSLALFSKDILKSETEKLINLVKGSHDNLFVAKTIFPFMFFADTLKIDRQKITIVHNEFLWRSQTASTEIKNITNIQTDIGILFGSITVTSRHFLNNTQTIRCLRRKDVATAQRLLQGFSIAQRAKIDTDNIEKEQLLILLNDLGQENRK